ncbi:lipoprotein [Sulfurospirillum arcachonense]|uniref:LptM family lipoprotein n=1 Tax=Sulfurospirillum arcachonense TaxID=57666 RepID=UPI0004685B0E|nr:hypothetical protein [Sulfurospirillum arcachonense]
MKNLIRTAVAIGISTALAGCGHFTFQGIKYRTGGAHSSSIGSVGLVRTELNNVYEPQFTPKWRSIEIGKVAEYTETKFSEFKIVGEAEISDSNNTSAGVSGSKTESGVRYIFELKDKDGLLNQINNNEDLAMKLKSDKNWRIVTSSVSIYSHRLSKRIAANASAKWTMDGTGGSGINIKAEGSSGSTLELKISDGTIVGYQYSRVCWGINSGKAELLIVDRLGPDVSCLDGMTHDPEKINNANN